MMLGCVFAYLSLVVVGKRKDSDDSSLHRLLLLPYSPEMSGQTADRESVEAMATQFGLYAFVYEINLTSVCFLQAYPDKE